MSFFLGDPFLGDCVRLEPLAGVRAIFADAIAIRAINAISVKNLLFENKRRSVSSDSMEDHCNRESFPDLPD